MKREEMVSTLEVKAIAALTAQALKIKAPVFRRWTRQRGHGHGHSISVPHWLKHQPEPYRIYYVVHEVCHGLSTGHGPDFKRAERRALKRWGMVPRYRRAYPHTLLGLDGVPVWESRHAWIEGRWLA
jgi:hypothetical protein